MGEREDAMINDRAADAGGEFAGTGTTPRAETGHALRASDDDRFDDAPDDEADEAARLRSEIEQTRAGMGETIDAIQEKLNPENIREQVVASVREATIGRVERVMENVGEKVSEVTQPAYEAVGRAGTVVRETGSSVIDTIRRNPLPAALIGLGVGLLVINTRRDRADGYDYYEPGADDRDEYAEYDYNYSVGQGASRARRESVLGRAQHAVGDAVTSARETASSAAQQARERIDQLGGEVQRTTRMAGQQLQTTLQQNPLAVGAVAVALGAAVGLAMPSTRIENEYMGETRDNLFDVAQQAARDTMRKVQTVAQDAGRMLQEGGEGQGGGQARGQGQGQDRGQGQGQDQAQAAGQGSA